MNSKSFDTADGHCLCGAVSFRINGAPLWVAHCHCQSCRRNTGSVVATFIGCDLANVEFLSEPRKFFASSAGVQRGFCGGCGTPVSYESDRYPGEIHIYLSTMNEPEKFTPKAHVYTSEQIRWFECHDALPRYAETSREGSPDSHGPLADS